MNATDPFIEQVVLGAVTARVMEWLKNWKSFPVLSQHSVGWNRGLSVAVAMLTSAGFTGAVTGSWDAGWQLNLITPNGPAIISFAYHTIFQFFTQEATYKGLLKPVKPETIAMHGEIIGTGPGTAVVDAKGISATVGSEAAEAIDQR